MEQNKRPTACLPAENKLLMCRTEVLEPDRSNIFFLVANTLNIQNTHGEKAVSQYEVKGNEKQKQKSATK